MPERLRAHREGIDRLLQHVVAGVVGDAACVNLDQDELHTLLDALPVAVLVSADRACSRIWGNAAACQLYQLPEGQNFSRTSSPDELPPFEIYANGRPALAEDLPLQRAARTGIPVAQSECEIRFSDGRRIFIAGHSIPLRNDYGEVCGSLGAFLDLTPQRRELERLEIISREMSHRLKNTLAIVQSIAHKTLRPMLDADVFSAFEKRLISLGRHQDLLHRHDWKGVALAQVANVALDGVADHVADRISIGGPDVTVPAETALMLSMVLHELATNAVKHGALGTAAGKVSLAWDVRRAEHGQTVRLVWAEAGGRPPADRPAVAGFGTSMMNTVARSLPMGRLDLQYSPTMSAALTFVIDG